MKAEQLQAGFEKPVSRLDRRLGGVPSLLVQPVLAFDWHDGPIVARSIAYYTRLAAFSAILALIVFASLAAIVPVSVAYSPALRRLWSTVLMGG